MGIIQRQAIKSTLINFIGIGFGSVSRFMMPLVMSSSQLGIINVIASTSGIFYMIFTMGYNLILKGLFPKYRDEENGHSGFLVFGLMITLLGIVLALISFYFFGDFLMTKKNGESELLKPFVFLIPFIIIFRLVYINIEGYVRMLMKTVVGTFIDGFLAKVFLLGFLLLFTFSIVSFESFVYLYGFALAMPGVLIIIYAFYTTKKITLPTPTLLKEYPKIKYFVLFGVLSGASGSIVQLIDIQMIYKMSDPGVAESLVGVYSIMFFAASLINIPSKNIRKIASVLISESWQNNDKTNIQDIYTKSSVNLLIIGTYMLAVGWACLDPVFDFLDPEYRMGKYVFLFLGLARVVELGTGVNFDIIETSVKYRYNTYFNIILAVLVIGLNYVFILEYGIVGAAFASFLAQTIINILRSSLINKAFGFKLFSKELKKVIVFSICFLSLVYFIDYEANPFLRIILNFSVVSLVFAFMVVKLKLSQDINEWLLKIKLKFLK
jgi:O-antigen/teichoic acid export membrane protein